MLIPGDDPRITAAKAAIQTGDVLLDAGADIEADGAVIAGGTAMADATAFGNWEAGSLEPRGD